MANTPKSVIYEFMQLSPGVFAAKIESIFSMGTHKVGKVFRKGVRGDTYFMFEDSNKEPEVGDYAVVYGPLTNIYYLTPEEFEQEYVSLQDMCI